MCTKKLSCTLNLHTCTHTHTYSFSNPEHHNQTSSEVSKFLLKAPNNPTLSVPRSPVPRTRTKGKLPHSHWKQSHSPASLVPPRTRGTAFCAAIIKKNGAKQKKKKKRKKERRSWKKEEKCGCLEHPEHRVREWSETEGGSRFASLRETIPPCKREGSWRGKKCNTSRGRVWGPYV